MAKRIKALEKIDKSYWDEYINNEIDANRQMVFVNALAGIAMFVVWILFLTKVFPLHYNFYILVSIILPIDVLILISPILFLKNERIKKPGFKYFLVFSFMMVIMVFNIILPKHGIMGWALCIVMVNHYYNPNFGRTIFVFTLLAMLGCMYVSMFVGEYDPNLITDGIVGGNIVYPQNAQGEYYLPDSPTERYELLTYLLSIGENRFLKVFAFYYVSRGLLLTILFFICNGLNMRTYKLLISEIKVNSEKEKIGAELNIAKEIQLSTLPNEFISSEDIEILGELKAAKEVGGDFYDYFNLDDDHVAVLVGDVSGKGVPAAMFMMKTITCFKNFISSKKNPSQILSEVNKTIFEGNHNQMFVTCFLAIINTKTGLTRFANAGHNPPIVGKNHTYRYLKCKPGFVLGGLYDSTFHDEETTLENGESIILYTDGYTEARNKSGAFYGEERLLKFLNSKDFTCILQMHRDLKDDVDIFVNGAEQADDMTIITIKYHGDKYLYSELECEAVKENIPTLLDTVAKFLEDNGLDLNFKNKLLVVGDELFSNIVNYAYKDMPIGAIYLRLLYNFDRHEFVMTIIDTGVAFNPLDINNNPISDDESTQRIGGLGILIVKKIMTEVVYDRINDKNILTLKKRL